MEKNNVVEELGEQYSRSSFDAYKRRGKVSIETKEGHTHQTEIYTTDTNKESVRMFLLSRASEKVSDIQIPYWTTRENDEAVSKLLEEI